MESAIIKDTVTNILWCKLKYFSQYRNVNFVPFSPQNDIWDSALIQPANVSDTGLNKGNY